MIDFRNKMKKKRKVSDAAAEVHVKKKKSKNHETDEISCPVEIEVSKTPVVDSQESLQVSGKEKVKKKKRKFTEALETPIASVDENPLADGESAPTSSKIQNGAANSANKTNGSAKFEALETSMDNAPAQSNDKKREKKKKRKLNGEAAPGNNVTQNGQITADANCNDSDSEDGRGTKKVSNKEANKLTGKALRKSFNSQGGVAALSKFLAICKENTERDLAADYLQAGGSLLEILRLLDTSEKKNLSNANAVFSAMHLIIMKILAEYPQYQSRAEEACRHFINSHLSFVHSMLSSQSNAKNRKTVLQLLASMVSLGGSLPRELLGHLSFHSQVLDTLSEHTKPTDPRSVRTCFIHFVLAFLVEGNTPVIRAMLDKRGMLSCIFPELIYDSHTTVHLVLDTVKTYVLENPAISKTSKLHVFSTPVLQNLVSLYNWKGPKNWPGPKGKKREATKDIVNPEEKEIAVEAVHNFLITLLTSYRQGVIFHDRTLGTSGTKNNQLVNTILQSLDRPWEHPRPMDLVIRVLVACPDLIRSQLNYTEPFLEPRASKKWILVMRFVGKLIGSLNADGCLKPCLPELTGSQLVSAVVTLTIPLVVLKNAVVPSIHDSHMIIRQEAVILLTTMLRQAKAFVDVVQNNCHDAAEFVAFKHAINDYIAKNVPSLESILKVWSLGLKPEDESEQQQDIAEFVPKRHDHFEAILDLLEAYRDLCPERLDLGGSTSADLQPTILLTGLNDIPNVEIDELVNTKVKALQFVMAVDTAAFAPSNSLFGETLPFLIALLAEKSTEVDSHSRKTIKMLLTASGMFEGCNEQMDIWINSFTIFDDPDERLQVANWFVKVIQHAIKRTDKYLDIIGEAEEIAGEQAYSAERLEEIFNDLYERDSGCRESRVVKMLPWVSISPLLCSAMENLKKNPNESISKLLSYVAVLTLHCQAAPGTLIHLTKNVSNLTAKEYLSSWLENETPTTVKKPFGSASVVSRLSKRLLADEAFDIGKCFTGEKSIEFEHRGKKINFSHDLSEYEVGSSLRMTLFYLTQFMQRGVLSQEQFDKYVSCIIALLHIAKNLRGSEDCTFLDECSRTIFMHPAILQYFSPFCKSKSVVESIVTRGLLHICQALVDLNEKSDLTELFRPFKNKLISQLRLAAKKCKNGGKVKNALSLMEFVEILRPSTKDIVDILTTVMELPKDGFLAEDKVSLSIWGTIVAKLVESLSRKNNRSVQQDDSTMDANFVTKFTSYLTQLKSSNHKVQLDSWEDSLKKYLESYPHNIAGVDGRDFKSMLSLAKTRTSINLLSFLVSRNNQFAQLFMQVLSKNPKMLQRSDLVFPILASNLSYAWTKDFLSSIYAHYKNDVTRYFAEPSDDKNWVSRHVEATVFLIESCFDSESCEKACSTVLSNGDKLDSVDLSYAKLVESLFRKSADLSDDPEDRLTKLVQVLIRVTVSALKKDSKNDEKLRTLCTSIRETIARLKSKNSEFVFEELNKNYSWPQFTRFSLKLGLKSSKDDKRDGVPLLRTLVSVCDVAYGDASENEYVKTLFEMTTSHSEFVNLMLSSQTVKRDLLELLWILVRKNHSTMASSQIPLYLAAYNATLSESDQLILMILRHYESNGIKLNEYRPYLWGEAAATYYSVKGEADTALWRQPSTSQVLDLFNSEMINETIKNFPVHRDFTPKELCVDKKVYDPSFYLPLLTYLLSENNVVACHKVTQSGALALVFAACGSACEDTRLAAYVVIKRFYFHVEATSSKEKLLWIRLIDALRNGIIGMDVPLKAVRLSCLVSTFLARTSLVTTRPMDRLYSSIQTFFMAKPAMELNTIPELLNFFHNTEVEHLAHRHWILEVIRDGMKTDFDMKLALRCVVFKILQGFYSSVLADPVTKRLILQVIEATVKIPKAGLCLSQSYGLIPWLNETAGNLDPRDVESVNLLVSIIRELLNTVLKTNDHDSHLQFLLLLALKSLKPRLSRNMGVSRFGDYASSLADIMPTKASFREALSRQDLEELVELGKKILGDVDDIVDCLKHGIEYVNRTNNSETGSGEITIARSSLRKLILAWSPAAR